MNQHFTRAAMKQASIEGEDALEGRTRSAYIPFLRARMAPSVKPGFWQGLRSQWRLMLGHKPDTSLKEVLEEALEDHPADGAHP